MLGSKICILGKKSLPESIPAKTKVEIFEQIFNVALDAKINDSDY